MVRTYNSYLRIDELLNLQTLASDPQEHDETLFIVIHQVYELWFKQVLHECALLQKAFEDNDRPLALATLHRVLTIFKTLVSQVDILETMTPVSFSSFRHRLDTASGFQSTQFREIETILGHRRPGALHHIPEDNEARRRLEDLQKKPSVYDSFLRFLSFNGHPIPEDMLSRDPVGPPPEDERVQQILIDIYRNHPLDRDVCERLVDLDEGLQEWRYRHVKMVQRTIGVKMGTGGSPGAKYLETTLFKALFPDLWTIRASL
ncbi:MAG TPA: tryptophan 2,3-dioxygenase family protein [Thermoanaerobaculia bacterium]|nr:tryptophan 2,3-dioxygenase family protein [Thermoanaerobaculia bacterium]